MLVLRTMTRTRKNSDTPDPLRKCFGVPPFKRYLFQGSRTLLGVPPLKASVSLSATGTPLTQDQDRGLLLGMRAEGRGRGI